MLSKHDLVQDTAKGAAADYVRRSLALMEDTDWSCYSKLQDVSSGDMIAAALGLYQHYGMRHPNSDDMINMLLHRPVTHYYADANALACSEQQEFMDQADALGLPSHLLDSLSEAIVNSMRQRWTERRWTFVDLSARVLDELGLPEEKAQEGYYVFTAL